MSMQQQREINELKADVSELNAVVSELKARLDTLEVATGNKPDLQREVLSLRKRG